MSIFRLKFYGTRGSIPVCDPSFQVFGGDTTCIAIYRESKDIMTIIDAGTGIRKLGMDMKNSFPNYKELFLMFSHFHWDHIQGFPFFAPAYDPNSMINICAMDVNHTSSDLRQVFEMQMQELYFPVELNKMGSQFKFFLHEESQINNNGAIVTAIKQNHPGDSYGYRIEEAGKSIVVCTDLEHGDTLNEGIIKFAQNADLLIHEAQYTSEELQLHKGWGHSSYDQAIEVAQRANVKQLIMTHHDPSHNDEFLLKQEKLCQRRFKNCLLARQGMEIQI